MYVLILLFCISLLGGQLFRMPLYRGITVFPHDIILCVLFLYWRFIEKGSHTVTKLRLFLPIQLFFCAILISLAINISSHTIPASLEAIAYALRFFLYISLYAIVSHTTYPKVWLRGLYAAGVLTAFLGVVQYIWYPDLRYLQYLGWDPHYFRLFSIFLDPNFAGMFIIFTLYLGIAIWNKTKYRMFGIGVQLVLLLCLVMTLSRSSYLAFSVSFIFYALWTKQWKWIFALMVFISAVFFLPLPFRSITPITRETTSIARWNNWVVSTRYFSNKPIFGYGFNYLRSIQEPQSSDETARISHASGGVDNSFLFVLITTGIVGGSAFLYLLWTLFTIGRTCSNHVKTRVFGNVYLASLVALCTHSMFNNSFFYPWMLIWLWILTALVERKNYKT